MKRNIITLVLCLVAGLATAQQYMRLWNNGTYTQVELAEAGEMPFTDGSSVTIAGNSYPLAVIDSITFGARVLVTYTGTAARVTIPSQVSGVTAQVAGADVVITNTNASEEMEFVLRGVSQQGSLTYNGAYKTTILLDGLNLTSTRGAAIDIQCGKRIAMKMTPGSDNMLEDCIGGAQKAALYCKGHLELSGAGVLTVKGNTGHAISTKEYMEVKKTVAGLNVTGSVKDALHVGQYFKMNGGRVTLSGNGGDGLQVERTKDPEDEKNGMLIIKGGTLTSSATQDDAHVIKADSTIVISGGTINLTASGAGSRCIDANADLIVSEDDATVLVKMDASGDQYTNPDDVNDKSRSRQAKVDGDMTVRGGTLTGKVTGEARGVKVDGTFYKLGGKVEVEVNASDIKTEPVTVSGGFLGGFN